MRKTAAVLACGLALTVVPARAQAAPETLLKKHLEFREPAPAKRPQQKP